MNRSPTCRPEGDDAALYEIRIQGHLEARWSSWFDDLTLAHQPDGTTVLHGIVADQSALHGLLQRVRDLGLSLDSVTRHDVDDPTTPKELRP